MTERQIAVCRDHADLVEAIRARMTELEVVPETVDHLAGLPLRYLSKILAARAYKSISSMSLGPVLQVLGLKLIVVEDIEALEKIRHRLVKRKSGGPKHSGAVHLTFSRRYFKKIGRNGGENSRKYLTRAQARELARNAALARWSKANRRVSHARRASTANGLRVAE